MDMQRMERKTYFMSSTLASSARRGVYILAALAAAGLALAASATAAERGRPVAAERGRAIAPGPGGPGVAGGQHGFTTFRPSTGRPAEGADRAFARGPVGEAKGGPMGRPGGGPAGERRGTPAGEPKGGPVGGPGGATRFGEGRGGAFARNGLPRRPFPGEAGFTGVPPRGETRFVNDEMIVHVSEGVSPQLLDAAARRLGLTLIESQQLAFTSGTLAHFRVGGGVEVADAVRALEAENIGIAQPNYVYRLQQDPRGAPAAAALPSVPKGDPVPYVTAKLRLADVHRIATGDNVLVAVIDSRVDAAHPDLAGSIAGEFDATSALDQPDEHGTGMTGAIAAHRKVLGVAPRARILAIHAFSPNAQSRQATSQSIVAGIDWAIAKGARVINMSFAGPYDPILQVALKKAHDKGIVLIAAAGNQGPKSPPLYPAADENVIAVTAVDVNNKLLAQANRGPHIALASPGVDVLETAPRGRYAYTTGTSVAAAHVSGVAALLIERDPAIDVATLENILFSTAVDLGTPGRDEQFGFGLVDPYRALNELEAQVALGRAPDRAGAANHAADRAENAGPAPVAGAEKSAAFASASASPTGAAPAASAGSSAPSSAAPLRDNERGAAGATVATVSPAKPATSTPARSGASQSLPATASAEDVNDLPLAAERKREACLQDGFVRHVRGSDMAEFVTACVDDARLACLKQATAQRIRAPERREFVNRCLAGL
jgi:subtilisin family serine protease